MQPGARILAREEYSLHPIGRIRSALRALSEGPRQGPEGAPDAWVEVNSTFARALFKIAAGEELIVVTWLHRADRDVPEVHPRDDPGTSMASPLFHLTSISQGR